MAQKSVVANGVPILELEEAVIGSQLKISVYFERLVSENPDVFAAVDFTGMTLKAEIKDKVKTDTVADAEFVCATRVEAGWVDLTLSGTITATLAEKVYYSSLKVWPTGQPEKGDTLVAITIPMKFKATR